MKDGPASEHQWGIWKSGDGVCVPILEYHEKAMDVAVKVAVAKGPKDRSTSTMFTPKQKNVVAGWNWGCNKYGVSEAHATPGVAAPSYPWAEHMSKSTPSELSYGPRVVVDCKKQPPDTIRFRVEVAFP